MSILRLVRRIELLEVDIVLKEIGRKYINCLSKIYLKLDVAYSISWSFFLVISWSIFSCDSNKKSTLYIPPVISFIYFTRRVMFCHNLGLITFLIKKMDSCLSHSYISQVIFSFKYFRVILFAFNCCQYCTKDYQFTCVTLEYMILKSYMEAFYCNWSILVE